MLGQKSTSGSTIRSLYLEHYTQVCSRCGSHQVPGKLLLGHWVGPWVERTNPELWLRGARIESYCCLKVQNQDHVCRPCSGDMSVSPMWSPSRLHGSLTITGAKHVVVLGSSEIQTGMSPDMSLGQQDCLWTAAGRG